MIIEYVDFPAIGLRVPVARTLFQVFGQYIYTYAIIIALSIVLMIILGLRHAERYGIKQENIIDFMIFALPASIIGGRIYYVLFSWDEYSGNLLDVINIRQGGIAIYGAVIGAFATAVIFFKIKKLEPVRFLDFGVPYLILAQGIGRWGNFVNQEVFGVNTTLPWGMTSNQISVFLSINAWKLSEMGIAVDPAMPVHPTFLYESLWNFAIAILLFWMRRRLKYKGQVLFGYLIGYGVGRTLIEGLRTDSLMLGSVRISQLVSILTVVVSLIIIIFFRKYLKPYEVVPVVIADGAGEAGADETAYETNEAEAIAETIAEAVAEAVEKAIANETADEISGAEAAEDIADIVDIADDSDDPKSGEAEATADETADEISETDD